MTREEAKQILLLYRPGTTDAEEPDVIAAMAVARSDAELGRWFQQHSAFQTAMRSKLRQIPVPNHRKLALLAGPAQGIIVPAAWWRQRPVWFGAIGLAAMLTLAAVLTYRTAPPALDRFGDYQAMMVSKARNNYTMDWATSDMEHLRQEIKQRGAPADYSLTPALAKFKLTGGATFLWRNNPVAMVCFDRGDRQMVFLFVIERTAMKDAPPEQPQLENLNSLMTASWSQGDKTYVLAGPKEQRGEEFFKRYF